MTGDFDGYRGEILAIWMPCRDSGGGSWGYPGGGYGNIPGGV